jgi:hypothetical protein
LIYVFRENSKQNSQIAGIDTAQSATTLIVSNDALTTHTRYVMGLKKRSLSLVERGQPTHHRYKRQAARSLRARVPHEERHRLFRARHVAGERVAHNAQLAYQHE